MASSFNMLFTVLLAFTVSVSAFPSLLSRQDVASNITIPPPINGDTGPKVIPDAAHPFQAPGPDDQRGPCPGLNVLANHGYLPRNGVVSISDILNATREGLNMDYSLALGLAAFGMLSRGNVLLDKLSIGGSTPLVPPLPGNIDGTPGGLGKHGRFEGDLSMTRFDFGLGDNVNVQQLLFDQLLSFVNKHTDNETVTPDAMAEYLVSRFNDSIAHNPKFDVTQPRFGGIFGGAAFVLGFFSNSTEGVLTVPVMTSLLAHERFPDNWHRRASPLTGTTVSGILAQLTGNANATGSNMIVPGQENANGTFVVDTTSGQPCAFYDGQAQKGVPAALFRDGVDSQTKANANALFQVVTDLMGQGCPKATPGASLG